MQREALLAALVQVTADILQNKEDLDIVSEGITKKRKMLGQGNGPRQVRPKVEDTGLVDKWQSMGDKSFKQKTGFTIEEFEALHEHLYDHLNAARDVRAGVPSPAGGNAGRPKKIGTRASWR